MLLLPKTAGHVGSRPRIRGRFCRRGKYEVVCLLPAASLMDGPVSRNLQLFLCDKIAPGFLAWWEDCRSRRRDCALIHRNSIFLASLFLIHDVTKIQSVLRDFAPSLAEHLNPR